MEFQKSRLYEILKTGGGGLRVSEEARDAFGLLLESLVLEVARQAAAHAQAAKRKAVTAADVRLAIKELWD